MSICSNILKERKAPLAFDGKSREALAIVIPIGRTTLYIVINHNDMPPNLFYNLPKGVIRALKYLAEESIPKDATCFQLFFDKTSGSWRYLFMPTKEGFGRFIDRYIDLDDKKVELIKSREEFLEKFRPSNQDQFMFIVTPFNEWRQ